MDKFHYKGSAETKSGEKKADTKSHREHKTGKNPTKESKSKIDNSFAGRHLHETEHHVRMGHEISSDEGLPFREGDGATE